MYSVLSSSKDAEFRIDIYMYMKLPILICATILSYNVTLFTVSNPSIRCFIVYLRRKYFPKYIKEKYSSFHLFDSNFNTV
jgi:hypothetical protein